MSLKKGLAKHKQNGEEAAMNEFQQLHDRNTFKLLLAETLTTQEKKDALKTIMFLKEKRCRRLKGRTCADGRKQCKTIPKEDVALPTVAPESVILTSVIDAKENRDVAITDIPGAYLSADMDNFVIM
eukprot:6552809-Ditylum_brightwellii.AAC.2